MSTAFPLDDDRPQTVVASRMDFYEVLRRIGKGSYGSVYLARERSNHRKQWVVKRLPVDAAAKKEIDVMCKLKHRYIVKYKESFIYEDFTCIVMGWCAGGDLSNFIKEHELALSHVDEALVLRWLAQLLEALDYLHSDRHILHRDIKTQNIFLDESKSNVKLGDFGIARCLDSTGEMASTVIGTPFYMSPELCQNKPYNTKSDIWALGCVIYELMALKHAFEAANIGRLVMRIMSADFDPLPLHFSEDLRDVIKRMLALNPDDRPSVCELLELPIIKQAREGLPSAGTRNSVDLTTRHIGDGTPLSQGGVSPTQPLECASAAAVQFPPRRDLGLSIDSQIPPQFGHVPRACSESVSPITPIGSEGGSSSLTTPQPPDSAMKPIAPVHMQDASDPSQVLLHQISENYADDFEPEPDDAWEAQLPRSRTASSEAEHIQEEEGAKRVDPALPPDFIEDECSDGSYEDDFEAEQDVAIPAVKLNGSICAVPAFDAMYGKAEDALGPSADLRSSSLDSL